MYEKLFKIQNMKLGVKKNTDGYNYKYATLDQVWEKLQPILEKERLVLYHGTTDKEVCTLVKDLDSQDAVQSCMPLPDNLDPQKLGSAVTYFRRYNLLQLFNIMTDEDDDGASAKPTVAKTTTVPTAQVEEDLSEVIIG